MASPKPEPPANGARITIQGGKLSVPDHPILPFIEGDGTGPDIWRAGVSSTRRWTRRMAASARSRGWRSTPEKRRTSTSQPGCPMRRGRSVPRLPGRHQGAADNADRRWHPVAQRGASATARSLRMLRPVRWFQGVPSPVKHPELVDMVIFRENTERCYAGIEFEAGTPT